MKFLFMAAGGVTAIFDRRYRKKLVQHASATPTSGAQDMLGVLEH